ncbi:MAG: peptidoglycan editing factor PgeF [Hyphomicrobiaceae bacterium]|nr:peptidoglycan editing factor PgeF [Hyphomicrobiaceae bacterium]
MKTLADNLCGHGGIKHGFFGSRGGVSSGIYESLNCGLGSKDEADDVRENRARVAGDLGVASSQLISPWQIHSASALIVDEPWCEGGRQGAVERPKLDALVTKTPGLAIGILTADCAPVLFCDPRAGVIGAAHAGWRGAVGGVLDDVVEKMCSIGARKEDIFATVGPAISPEIYEVGDEFRDHFLADHPGNERFFVKPAGAKKVHFDLQAYAQHRLERAGLIHAAIIKHCTFTRESQYFSFRRSQKNKQLDYGRQISAIVIG